MKFKVYIVTSSLKCGAPYEGKENQHADPLAGQRTSLYQPQSGRYVKPVERLALEFLDVRLVAVSLFCLCLGHAGEFTLI